ncbi:acyl-CoA thioesterase [Listeria costaricensis]|uniref:acyl-CoA thioesterase n=1 Tax=Listeria costaricensis TaxID=2026604 RepID=UPI000C07A4C8|nr:thioesterase family protein [Listeria costaricensis]
MITNETEIEVRYAETDQMGVVYHTNYLVWMEIGRTRFIETLGLRYFDMEAAGYLSPVLDVQIHYGKPLRYGQTAIVKTWLEAYDGIRVTYGYEIRYAETGEIAVTGSTKHVCVKKETFQPIALRRVFKEWHQKYLSALTDEEN